MWRRHQGLVGGSLGVGSTVGGVPVSGAEDPGDGSIEVDGEDAGSGVGRLVVDESPRPVHEPATRISARGIHASATAWTCKAPPSVRSKLYSPMFAHPKLAVPPEATSTTENLPGSGESIR